MGYIIDNSFIELFLVIMVVVSGFGVIKANVGVN